MRNNGEQVLEDLTAKVWGSAAKAPPAGCAQYFRDVMTGDMPVVHGKASCAMFEAAAKEGKCITNALTDADVDRSNGGASTSPVTKSTYSSAGHPHSSTHGNYGKAGEAGTAKMDKKAMAKELRAQIVNLKAGLVTMKTLLAAAKVKYGKDCKADATTVFKAATATTTPASALSAGALLSLPSQCLPPVSRCSEPPLCLFQASLTTATVCSCGPRHSRLCAKP